MIVNETLLQNWFVIILLQIDSAFFITGFSFST